MIGSFINYLFAGILLMFILDHTSEYPWTGGERFWIILLWPIAIIIILHALYKRFTDERD